MESSPEDVDCYQGADCDGDGDGADAGADDGGGITG